MSSTLVTAGLIAAASLAAWLRFDMGALLLSWATLLVSLGAAAASWTVRARHLPPVRFPPNVEELAAHEELTPQQEAEFADGLRAWHRRQQRDAWRQIERRGPGPLIVARGVLYFLWSAALAIVALPPGALPGTLLPQVPRFVIVLLSLAAIAASIAVPLGIRDWRRATRAIREQ